MVKSAKEAERVMASVTRFVKVGLKLVVNKVKSRSVPLSQCAFLGFRIGARGKVQWTDKSLERFNWKQWKQPRTRRRNLHSLGANASTVHMEHGAARATGA